MASSTSTSMASPPSTTTDALIWRTLRTTSSWSTTNAPANGTAYSRVTSYDAAASPAATTTRRAAGLASAWDPSAAVGAKACTMHCCPPPGIASARASAHAACSGATQQRPATWCRTSLVSSRRRPPGPVKRRGSARGRGRPPGPGLLVYRAAGDGTPSSSTATTSTTSMRARRISPWFRPSLPIASTSPVPQAVARTCPAASSSRRPSAAVHQRGRVVPGARRLTTPPRCTTGRAGERSPATLTRT
mmetsp:Transcript_9116/g.25551  ORF Transcript_9116/g.25551 Transcript_9116/m.25551 type:complete len:247 (+) Transcript_9116:636-1376(+)